MRHHRSRWVTGLWLLRRALVRAYTQNCLGIAKGAAYSGLLALFPVITVTATILVQVQADQVSRILSRYLFRVVPPGTQELVRDRFVVAGEKPFWLLLLAALVALYAASGVMLSLMEGFNGAYHLTNTRSFLKQHLVAAELVFAAALPLLGASLLVLFGARTERRILEWLSGTPAGEQLSQGLLFAGSVARLAVATCSTVLITVLLYHIGPERKQKWGEVWRGAVLATALWWAATSVFAWYVRNVANYNVLYGSVGAVIALCVWMYVVAVIAMVGCCFNAEREHWHRTRAPALARKSPA